MRRRQKWPPRRRPTPHERSDIFDCQSSFSRRFLTQIQTGCEFFSVRHSGRSHKRMRLFGYGTLDDRNGADVASIPYPGRKEVSSGNERRAERAWHGRAGNRHFRGLRIEQDVLRCTVRSGNSLHQQPAIQGRQHRGCGFSGLVYSTVRAGRQTLSGTSPKDRPMVPSDISK